MANINVFIPPGATSASASPIPDASYNVANRLSNPNTINKQIQQARILDQMRDKLEREFRKIDINADGMITKEELLNYFRNEKVTVSKTHLFTHWFFLQKLREEQKINSPEDEEALYKVVDEIFDQVDYNGDGAIQMNEFILKYIETRSKLVERKEEIMRNIAEHSK